MHGPEAQSVFVTFASAFLIKVNLITPTTDLSTYIAMNFSCYNQNLPRSSPKRKGQRSNTLFNK